MKYLSLIRFQNLLVMVLIQYLLRYSIMVPAYGKENVLGDLYFASLVLSMILIAAGGYVINDYFDIQTDTTNENVIVGRRIKRRIALILHALLSSSGVLLGFYIAYKIDYILLGAFLTIASYILWEYSLRLKRFLFVGNLIVAVLTALFVISLSAYEMLPRFNAAESRYPFIVVCIYTAFAFISSLMNEIIKDLRTVEGDVKFKIKTLPSVWGIEKTKEFVKWLSVLSAFMIVAISTYVFERELMTLTYALLLLIGPLFLLNIWVYKAKVNADYERISKLNKLIIFAGILSLCFFIR